MAKEKSKMTKKQKVELREQHIKNKLLYATKRALIATVVVLVMISTFFNAVGTYRIMTSLMQETAAEGAFHISSILNGELDTVQEYASEDIFQGDVEKNAAAVLNSISTFRERNSFADAMYINADGITVDGVDLSQREYFQACKESMEPQISDPLISASTETMTIVLIAPVITDGNFTGAVVAMEDATFLSDIVSEITCGTRGNTFIVNSEGKMIAHDNTDLVLNEYNPITEEPKSGIAGVENLMIQQKTGSKIYTFDASLKVCAFQPIGINGWSIGLASEPIEYMMFTIIGIVCILIVSIVFVWNIIKRFNAIIDRVVSPILKSIDRARLLAEGDIHTEVEMAETNDEGAILTEAMQTVVQVLGHVIGDISEKLDVMAEGDFTEQQTEEYLQDLIPIQQSMEAIRVSMQETMASIQESSEAVAAGVDNLAESAQNLSQGATDQASAVEEITATIEDIARQAQDNARQANEAIELTEESGNLIDVGIERMEGMLESMNAISKSSAEIQDILQVIEEIADETNLLALNASIEAARAGEAGKGFAVIADNIGKLAENSAQSAKRSRELIQNTVDLVAQGNEEAASTKEALDQVAESAEQSNEKVQEISKISIQQSKTMEEVAKGIEQISGIVENNAATAEETSATGEEIAAQTSVLNAMINKFQI